MATLTPTITLLSSDTSSDVLSLTITDILTTTEPSVGVSRMSIPTTPLQVIIASGSPGTVYVYLKNTDDTNHVLITNAAGEAFGRLNPGEPAFVPLDRAAGLGMIADTADVVVEYAYWTKA